MYIKCSDLFDRFDCRYENPLILIFTSRICLSGLMTFGVPTGQKKKRTKKMKKNVVFKKL